MLIGLSGPLGAGKSLAAKIISDWTKYPVVPFAKPLKDAIAALGVDPKHIYGSQADKETPLDFFGGKSARHAVQQLGTEWGRANFGDDFWVRAWLAKAGSEVIADDVRFPNEAQAILDRGGCIIRIVRDVADENRTADHASERFTDVPFSFRVTNDKCPTLLTEKLLSGLSDFRASQRKAVSALAAAQPS